ncbi:ATP-dependent DNA helicase Q4 [Ceratobasidium sp. 414]|nr:ATP-dependent DNA helicase Q4 [Ceratobasidium sp. 414]
MVVWILLPLNYIEEEQVKAVKKWGIPAVAVNSSTDFGLVKQDILNGCYQVVISSPESFCQMNKLHQVVISEDLEDWFHLTVIDEAHCIHTWGQEFRVVYDWCGEMQGYMPANSLLVAATATCMPKIKSKLTLKLFMQHNLSHSHILLSL